MTEKLKQALKGTYFDNKKRYGLLFWVALAITTAFFIYIVPSPEPSELQTTRNSAPVLPTVSARKYFTVPPHGTVTVDPDGRGNCNSGSTLGPNVTRKYLEGRVVYTSTQDTPVTAWVVFYEQQRGMTCKQTATDLRNRGILD